MCAHASLQSEHLLKFLNINLSPPSGHMTSIQCRLNVSGSKLYRACFRDAVANLGFSNVCVGGRVGGGK